jgi:hypothetical protein
MLADEPTFVPYAPGAPTVKIVQRIHAGTTPQALPEKALVALGIAEGNANRVQRALRFLGLINPEFELTELSVRLRRATSDEYGETLSEIVRAAYEPIFVSYDPATASGLDLDNAFKPYDPAGQRPNMIALFMALCREAGLAQGSAAPRRGRPSAARVNREPANGTKKTPDQRRQGPLQPPPPPPRQNAQSRLHPAVQAWIDEMPDSGTAWDRADFESWLAIFKASVERAYKI